MPLGHIMRLDLEKIALEYIVPCLHEVGFCYLDNFLGEVVGDCVLERVKQLHCNGALRDGQLAGPRAGVSKRHLRGDQITWIGGNEEGCEAISFLLSLIDRLILYCGSRLGKYYVKERSKVGRARAPRRRCSPRGLGTFGARCLSPSQGCEGTLVFHRERAVAYLPSSFGCFSMHMAQDGCLTMATQPQFEISRDSTNIPESLFSFSGVKSDGFPLVWGTCQPGFGVVVGMSNPMKPQLPGLTKGPVLKEHENTQVTPGSWQLVPTGLAPGSKKTQDRELGALASDPGSGKWCLRTSISVSA
ncbi:hypothetical protein GH733_004757 [Mirounga leonina]|nr:hypothetical protein GH733_004757 [Mirounga leonina]